MDNKHERVAELLVMALLRYDLAMEQADRKREPIEQCKIIAAILRREYGERRSSSARNEFFRSLYLTHREGGRR
jgi:hypothetical protein